MRIVAVPPGAEGSLYIYEESNETVTVTPIYAPGSDPGKAPSVTSYTVSSAFGYACRVFWVDATGRIHRTAWSGPSPASLAPWRFLLRQARRRLTRPPASPLHPEGDPEAAAGSNPSNTDLMK